MFEKYSTAAGAANIVGIDLHTIWKVRADRTYDVCCERARQTSKQLHQQGGTGLIALRTLQGLGEIQLAKKRTIMAEKNTLVIFRWDEILRYMCAEKMWDFWWFEFAVTGPLHIPLDTAMKIKAGPNEHKMFQRACTLLRRGTSPERRTASAIVISLLYEWLASSPHELGMHPHKQAIDNIINQMYEHLRPAWAVSEMAEAVHMSVRNFRKVFQTITGQTPKGFYQHLRLSMAQELLRQQRFSINQVAYQLGFSSPFHLSREFNKHFGIPPSKFKNQQTIKNKKSDSQVSQYKDNS